MLRTALKRRELFQDVLCRRYYAKRVVAGFANQIQSYNTMMEIDLFL